jgi:prepilin-type N-terminal cleavage/methylation domain-containing protein
MRMRKITRWLVWGARRNAGFTLIELLIVIIIIAMLAAIAIPTFLGQRAKAQDTACYSLVRNGLTVIQSATVDTGGYLALTPAMLHDIENSFTWVESAGDLVVVGANPSIASGVVADTRNREIVFYRQSNHEIDLASRSESGNWYGIQINSQDMSQQGYVEVSVIKGTAQMGW